jgi:biphenyl 2,3-dioxygenase beta subunit/benzene/toluene dioxygenase beta subunit
MVDTASLAAMLRHHELSQFYFREARLLDERKFNEWVELFADDARYLVPTRSNRSKRDRAKEVSPAGAVFHVEDDKSYLRARVTRLESGMGWADEPSSRTRHLVGNIEVIHQAESSGELEVLSSFIVYRSRGEHDQTTFAGQRADRLRPTGSAFKIAHRVVLLEQSVILSNGLNAIF